ncbi:MAG: hypothetical protein RBT63_11285, partial [Bdellovibrionales bacterium]|nr:hypothetical protein [Bdellovibrionales bacterium]
HYVHLLPHEVAQAAEDARARVFMPIHWGMYSISLHDWFEPVAKAVELAKERKLNIVTPKLGEMFAVSKSLGMSQNQDKWWESHPDFIETKSPRK